MANTDVAYSGSRGWRTSPSTTSHWSTVRVAKQEVQGLELTGLHAAPQFHLFLENCTNGEIYNSIIRGGNEGGLDGMDVSGSNIWVHDLEVSNRDECVTIKNPAKNM